MGARVLIVDDAAFIRELLAVALEKHGFTVVGTAEDGAEAVIRARELSPDLILMDIVMPRKSGIEATREILRRYPDLKIVALSTLEQESMVAQAIAAGCHSYVVKPFETVDLIKTLREVLG